MDFEKLCPGLYSTQNGDIKITNTPRTLPRKKGENWGVLWATGMVGCSTRNIQSRYFRTLMEAKEFASSLFEG